MRPPEFDVSGYPTASVAHHVGVKQEIDHGEGMMLAPAGRGIRDEDQRLELRASVNGASPAFPT
jgi:hypothetical protein